MINVYTLYLESKMKLTNNVYSFVFKKPRDFYFSPGQYLKITLDFEDFDERGNSRYFTISSTSHEKCITITTRITNSPFKKKLLALISKGKIKAKGPYGSFLSEEKPNRTAVLISSGLGITPFRSFVLSEMKSFENIFMLAIFSSKKSYIFSNDFKHFIKKHKNVVVKYISREENEKISVIVKKNIEIQKGCVYYIAGAESFVFKTKQSLIGLGISDSLIKTEDFPGYK